jgi:glutamine synthetase
MSYLESDFGCNVFDDTLMKEKLTVQVFQRYTACKNNWEPFDLETANAIASALRCWAMGKGATHWCHWFQPLVNGHSAEKHEAFLDVSKGKIISNFTGNDIILQEPDGSSFPSGGLRSTHIARGYTVWDPLSTIFIKEAGDTNKILVIPACYFSWTGDALDRKIPLLRSLVAVTKATKRLFSVLGKDVKSVRSNSGCEQEFYLIDKNHFEERPDLKLIGRTIQGTKPIKNQELGDHYLAGLPNKAVDCIHDIEKEAWKIGIPIKTRHQEVAPNQFEMAPIFESSSIAADQNIMLMQMMRNVASKHNISVLFHEKPFAGYNGNGKHNNWSIGTDTIPTIFKPEDIKNNLIFQLGLTAVIRGIDLHQDIIRHAIASAGNDFRLGANEAPPSIISVYLGDSLTNFIEYLITGNEKREPPLELDLGVPYLPPFFRASTDRNRTSPFAFTGNKFEIRAVGGSQNPAISSTAINTIAAESFYYLADEIESLVNKGTPLEKAVNKVVKETLAKHQRIIFDQNGYSQDWVEEAKKRGLLNLKNTIDTLNYVNSEKNYKLYESLNVLSRREYEAFINADADNYTNTVEMEVNAILTMANRYIIPVGIKYLNEILPVVERAGKSSQLEDRYQQIQNHINNSLAQANKLHETMEHFEHSSKDLTSLQKAEYASNNFVPKSFDLRKTLDQLECLIPKKDWPFPSYEDILFNKLN